MPSLEVAVGARKVVLHRGLLRVDSPAPPLVPKGAAVPRGALAVLWTRVEGASAERTALWLSAP